MLPGKPSNQFWAMANPHQKSCQVSIFFRTPQKFLLHFYLSDFKNICTCVCVHVFLFYHAQSRQACMFGSQLLLHLSSRLSQPENPPPDERPHEVDSSAKCARHPFSSACHAAASREPVRKCCFFFFFSFHGMQFVLFLFCWLEVSFISTQLISKISLGMVPAD